MRKLSLIFLLFFLSTPLIGGTNIMGKAFELLVGSETVAGAGVRTAINMFAGNSNTLRAAAEGSAISLLSAWGDFTTNGDYQIRSPLMHDNVMGFTAPIQAVTPYPTWPMGIVQPLFSHDVLSLMVSSTGANDDKAMGLLVHYDDLPGADAQLISGDEVRGRTQHVLTIFNTLGADAFGAWQGEESLNADNDLLKSGRKYALLGGIADRVGTCIRWRSSDWANLGVGVPVPNTNPGLSSNYFVALSDATGIPLVPVIDADNLGAVLIDKHQLVASSFVAGTVLALLAE